jgi:hypothetical protein
MTIKEHTKETLIEQLNRLTAENKRMPNTHETKLRLIKLGIFQNICGICSIANWNGKVLSLHLDHIDGNPKNNLITNLRLLCPNCHSQTETYCGKNVNKQKKTNYCLGCNKVLFSSWTSRCSDCFLKLKYRQTKIVWPEKEQLVKMIQHHKMEHIAKELGVSSNAIKKHCKKVGIDYQAVKYFNQL